MESDLQEAAIDTDPARPVRLSLGKQPDALADVTRQAVGLRGRDIPTVLDWARQLGGDVALPGGGDTRGRWELLASVGAVDLTVARALEPHLDALAILAEAGVDHDGSATWGVYAAEAPTARLEASGGTLSGVKAWCSLAGQVDHALVTAWLDEETRGMYAVDLRHPGVDVDGSGWCPAGLREVVTCTLRLTEVPATAVGEPGWYLRRDGFAWGGIGVAAVWYGAAVGLARRIRAAAEAREPDDIALMHLGAIETDLGAAAAVLAAAADEVDRRTATGEPGEDAALLAARVRQVVADTAERMLVRAGHALGPAPLAHEPEHVSRVADLTLYLRQHHAERDLVALGRLALQADPR